jgi:hypothetical protein
MKDILAIALALLMVPFTAYSMDVMKDSELDSISASAEGDALLPESYTENEMESADDGSYSFSIGEVMAAQSRQGLESDKTSHGVAIYIYDVSFDLHIMNISGGDTDGDAVNMYR